MARYKIKHRAVGSHEAGARVEEAELTKNGFTIDRLVEVGAVVPVNDDGDEIPYEPKLKGNEGYASPEATEVVKTSPAYGDVNAAQVVEQKGEVVEAQVVETPANEPHPNAKPKK